MKKNNKNISLIFSTPIWASLVPNYKELNKKMYKYIKKIELKNPLGITKSNLMGWHSEDFDLNNAESRFFVNSISGNLNTVFSDMGWDLKQQEIKITSMWSIINKETASNSRHIHSNNFISAAYYIKAPENCGDIVFHDPRSSAVIRHPKILKPNKLNSNVFTIQPKEGLLVLFPSYLHHSVDLNRSKEERIVISFNIDLKPIDN